MTGPGQRRGGEGQHQEQDVHPDAIAEFTWGLPDVLERHVAQIVGHGIQPNDYPMF